MGTSGTPIEYVILYCWSAWVRSFIESDLSDNGGSAENAGPENAGQKTQDWKMQDQKCRGGNAEPENARTISRLDLNWEKRKNAVHFAFHLHYLILECIDYLVNSVVTSAFNWHIINWSLSK